MKTTTKFWKLLPVAAAALALGGCGGGGSGNDDSDTPASSGSIIDCFTANKTVNFAMTSSNMPAGTTGPSRSTTGPMNYNGQSVTGQAAFYISGSTTYATHSYWKVTTSGVTMIAYADIYDTATPDGTFYPKDMTPGQTVTSPNNVVNTFIGFETVNLAGKTFSNTCHFKGVDTQGHQVESWFAPQYGNIQQTGYNGTSQYNGDL